jgi:ABC-2 type transport system ATP-binding protein
VTAAIETNKLCKSYGDVKALCDFDLRVEAGTILGLLGPNGAGKTTAVRILTTLLQPDSGSARVAGFDVVREAARLRARIGLAGQYAAVDENLTGLENLEMVGRLYHLGRRAAKERARELLADFGLEDAGGRPAGGYSGGMRRRLDLAAALVARPPVLFLDEPTTGLDVQSRSALWEEVQRLAGDRGVTVFLTTQYLEEADVLADRVGIIDHGRIVAEGTPEALKDEIGRPSVEAIPQDPAELEHMKMVLSRFGESVTGSPKGASVRLAGGDAQLAEVVRALDSENIVIKDLQLHAPSLDDVFLAKTGRSLEGEADAEPEPEPESEPAAA